MLSWPGPVGEGLTTGAEYPRVTVIAVIEVPAHLRVEDLVPHRPPMLWIDAVLEHGPRFIACSLLVEDHPAYGLRGEVEPIFAVEWMAQTVAAFTGLRDRARGETPRPGFLVGAPRVDLHTARFSLGQILRIDAEHTFGDADLASFECAVREGAKMLADATLNFVRPKPGASLHGGLR